MKRNWLKPYTYTYTDRPFERVHAYRFAPIHCTTHLLRLSIHLLCLIQFRWSRCSTHFILTATVMKVVLEQSERARYKKRVIQIWFTSFTTGLLKRDIAHIHKQPMPFWVLSMCIRTLRLYLACYNSSLNIKWNMKRLFIFAAIMNVRLLQFDCWQWK